MRDYRGLCGEMWVAVEVFGANDKRGGEVRGETTCDPQKEREKNRGNNDIYIYIYI